MKIQNRIMGDYSIAKSYKGILRIAHIVDLVEGDPDSFLNPRYYGSPKQLLNISGGTYASEQKGVQSAVYSLKGDGTISRYNLPDDELRNRRVPMTDSMGNFLNWYVGSDGVTIGSNEEINSNRFFFEEHYQSGYDEYPIYQEKFFPVLKSNSILIGKENKIYPSNKTITNQSSLSIEGDAKLIVQNLYKKENYAEQISMYRPSINGVIEEVKIRNYENVIDNGTHKKLRTIYNNNKQFVQDFDVLMYRQNDWDCHNYNAQEKFTIKTTGEYENSITYNRDLVQKYSGLKQNDVFYKKGQVLDCNVDVVNLREYVLDVIKKFSQDNIIEVPSGTVIWQYCSLEKWRAYGDIGTGDGFNKELSIYSGHRPSLENRNPIKSDNMDEVKKMNKANNVFQNSTIQGASKKINHIKRQTAKEDITKEKETDSVVIQDADSFHDELIPLYKRDYVLCDGSVYRIPYYPNFTNKNLSKLNEHRERFFELFFNVGYRYTDRSKMLQRPHVSFKENTGEIKILNSLGDELTATIIPDVKQPSSYGYNTSTEWTFLSDPIPFALWEGKGAPDFSNYPSTYDKLDDIDVLFGEDLATMLAIDLIYDEYLKHHDNTGVYLNYQQLRNWCINDGKGQPLPEEYIFNSFIGDNEASMEMYWKNSFHYGDENTPTVMKVPYKDATSEVYNFFIGREVNNLNSYIKFYDADCKVIRIVKVYDLPLVNFFMEILSSTMFRETNLRKYLYTYYNFDFQVPTLLPQDGSPSFIGTCGWEDSDENRCKWKKVIQWYTRFSHSTRPHRHAMFSGKSILDNLNQKPVPDIYSGGHLDTVSPVNIAGFWGGQDFNFPKWNKKGGTNGKITEENGNYIINQHYLKTDEVDVNGMRVKVLVNDGTCDLFAGDKSRNRYGWKTGKYRTFTPKTEADKDNIIHSQAPKEVWLNDWDENTPLQTLLDYYNYHSASWYALLPKEDPRFDTSEPNRGISSPPIPSTTEINISYEKINDNAKGYYPYSNNEYAKRGFFSPQHITMLPLIKI